MSKGKEKEKVVWTVEINGEVYTLDSGNKWLLKQLEGGKKKDEKGNRVEQRFDYLPMNMVYRLMDGLFQSYDITSHDMVQTWESYVVKKFDYTTKTNVDEDVKVFGKKVSITVKNFDGTERTVVGYGEGVAGIGILSKDNARNGFVRKLTARARKEALANLWQVFRIDAEFDMDTDIEVDAIKDEAKIEWVAASSNTGTAPSPTQILKDKFTMLLGEKLIGKDPITKAMLIAALKEIKKENDVKDDTIEHQIIKDLLNSFLPQVTK